jgi:hypothetical protein
LNFSGDFLRWFQIFDWDGLSNRTLAAPITPVVSLIDYNLLLTFVREIQIVLMSDPVD